MDDDFMWRGNPLEARPILLDHQVGAQHGRPAGRRQAAFGRRPQRAGLQSNYGGSQRGQQEERRAFAGVRGRRGGYGGQPRGFGGFGGGYGGQPRGFAGVGGDDYGEVHGFPENRGRFHSATDDDTDSQTSEPRRPHARKVTDFKTKKKAIPKHFLTSEKIAELATIGDTDDLLTLISQNEVGFLKAFQCRNFLKNKITLKHLVKLLFDLVESEEISATSRVMCEILDPTSEYAAFFFSVQEIFQNISTEQKRHIRIENIEAFSQFVRIAKFCIEKIPNNTVQVFQLPLLIHHAGRAKTSILDDKKALLATIETDLQQLQASFDRFEREKVKPKPKPVRRSRQMIDAERDPPEPFTDLSILPIANEISCEAKPFLRPNITHKSYNDWGHYIDIQFRLLREDFVRPLRKGIDDHLVGKSSGGDVRVYTKVRIMQPVSLSSGLGFDISFECQSFRKLNWNYTKRLINGSLLCISADKFVTIAFATVAERKVESLQKGIVTVKFEGSVGGFQLNPDTEYTIVESVAYFEAYRHILGRLQEVVNAHEIEAMPFKQYIVECSFNDIPLPLYTRFQQRCIFNLQGVIKFKRTHRFPTAVDLTDLSTWPKAGDTDLDRSQMKAMKAAMTQDLSVIQGPPGTGKTYIGLKIVQSLLANRKVWDPYSKSPILVVCYTNHALDQFLEGIRQHLVDGKPPNLTRIGGRCKSEILADCTLYEKVNRAREARSIPREIHKEFAAARTEMMTFKKEIEKLMDETHSAKVSLLTIQVLSQYMSRHHCQQITHDFGAKKPIEAWLGLRYSGTQQAHSPAAQPPHTFKHNADLSLDSDEDSDNEVQIILHDRLEQLEKVYRPQQGDLFSPFDMAELEEEIDPEGWQTAQMDKKKRHNMIRKQLSRGLVPLKQEDVHSIRNLQPQEKWRLYIYWRDRHTEHLLRKLQELSTDYERACKEFQEKKQQRDDFVVAGSDVVGMTTTGAAKHNHIIKAIKPKIVIFEEAAEIFEPHIFTSISSSVQQLILIGDHKQLRPKPTCYELETRYNFNVSLFERLAMNGCPVQTLSIQHRMRPEIASLITPAIYEELHNHESVERYDSIKGVGKDLFFVHHNFAETSDDVDRKSHSNPHEAKFLTALCDYLIKQGYDQSEITMLTLYSGQVIEIKKNLKLRKITGVRTVVVDDFQGEENEIILLSLVRSNSEKNIGFVGIKNRVCVALSRAKKGMFISGNALMLIGRETMDKDDKDDPIWPQVLGQLKQCDGIGESLPLQCQIHKDQAVKVKKAEDFAKCPEGGCQKLCNTRLDCGHACKRLCHPCDREHKNYKCIEKTKKKLPRCSHYELVSCSADIKKVKCSATCEKMLPCGHRCAEKCLNPCTIKCKHPVEKKLSCGHTVQADCYVKPELVVCSVPCTSLLECEHECSGTCGECHRGRLHVQCKVKCDRTLICEHICKFPCTPTCPPCTEVCKNFCVHSECRKMCFELCKPCLEPCKWSCKHKKCTRPCGEPCNRESCNKPCTKMIKKCGHPCIGLCGEPCPKLCRICDKDEVTEIFFGNEDDEDARFVLLPDCKHIFEYKGLDHWMEIKKEGDQSQQISFKECPKCKTPVKKCLRYSNAIKQYLKDVEEIKLKQMSTLGSADLKGELITVQKSLDATNYEFVSEDLAQLERIIQIDSQLGRRKLLMFPHVVKAKLTFLSQIASVTKLQYGVSRELAYLSDGAAVANISSRIRKVKRGLNQVKEFIQQDYLFDQQMSDAETEMCRLTLLARVSEVQQKALSKRIQFAMREETAVTIYTRMLHSSGWKNEKVSKKKEDEVVTFLKTLAQKYGLDGLTETERKDIVKAIGLSKGHWFKCPNGHFYCIGECGGAMETVKCPECTAEIGGGHHQLLANNQVATEMDGARHAAWSEMANLENFDPAQLQFAN